MLDVPVGGFFGIIWGTRASLLLRGTLLPQCCANSGGNSRSRTASRLAAGLC